MATDVSIAQERARLELARGFILQAQAMLERVAGATDDPDRRGRVAHFAGADLEQDLAFLEELLDPRPVPPPSGSSESEQLPAEPRRSIDVDGGPVA